jgi:hydrogenase maturation protein HypF
MVEHGIEGPVFGVAWDGSGAGTDGTIWGGEFLRATYTDFERRFYLRPFGLPGGEAAVREPRRVALSLLHEAGVLDEAPAVLLNAFTGGEIPVLRRMLDQRIHCPASSSAGRLFDAAASLIGLCQINAFSGQAAMALEASASECREPQSPWPFPLLENKLDWTELIRSLLMEQSAGVPATLLAWRFHRTLAEGIALAASQQDLREVVLTGGCFQNALLTSLTVDRLESSGFRVYTHRYNPPNDGGISLGQAAFALRQRIQEE